MYKFAKFPTPKTVTLVSATSQILSETFFTKNIYQLSRRNFEARHPRCVGSITKNFCVLHNTVEHNYISSSSTVGIQLHVSALYVGHLQVII